VDVLTSKLAPRARLWARAWSTLAALAAALVLVANGWSTAMFSRSLGIVAEGNVEIPVFWVQLALPLGGAMMALVALEALARLAAGAPPAEAPHGVEERPE
jgi:TRAP-type C4-dicarboxylate transport system permease small subunit